MLTLKQLGQWKDPNFGHRLAFAPDGRSWAAGENGSLALFRDAVFDRRFDLGAHAEDVRFSADGRQLYAGPFTYDRARADFVDSGKPTSAMLTGLPGVSPASYALTRAVTSPDGAEVVLAARFLPPRKPGPRNAPNAPAGRLLLLQARSFEPIAVLMDGRPFDTLAVDDRHIAGVSGASIFVFDRKRRKPIAELTKQLGIIGQLSFSPDGKYLASVSAGRDHLIVLWDTATWSEARSWSGDDEGVAAVVFHPTRPLLLTGGYDHHVKVWSLADGTLEESLACSTRITGLALSPSADRLAVAEDLPERLTLYQLKWPTRG